MMTKSVAALFAALLLSLPAVAQWQPYAPAPTMPRSIESVGLFVDLNQLNCDAVGCALSTTPLIYLDDDPSKPLCPELSWYGSPHTASARGGVAVGDDEFLTVHAVSEETCLNRAVLLGYYPSPAGMSEHHIFPLSSVYLCEEVLDGGTNFGPTLLRLDRPTSASAVLGSDPSGKLLLVHFPQRLALQVEEVEHHLNQRFNGHVLDGSSGGAVFNGEGEVVALVKTGSTDWMQLIGGCWREGITPIVPWFLADGYP